MSGDLADPGRSIPTGTFAALLTTVIIYSVLVILVASSVTREGLLQHVNAMEKIALISLAVSAGVFAAIGSSLLGSLIGILRVLNYF